MLPRQTDEEKVLALRKARGIADGYPVYVWHPEYAPVHPAACDSPEALATLRAQGWVLSREALSASRTDVSAVEATAATAEGDPVEAMVEEETRSERKKKKEVR